MFKEIDGKSVFIPESKFICIGDKQRCEYRLSRSSCDYCYIQRVKKLAGMEHVLIETDLLYDEMYDRTHAKSGHRNEYYYENLAKYKNFLAAFIMDRSTQDAEEKAIENIKSFYLGSFPKRWQTVTFGTLDRVQRAQAVYKQEGWKTAINCQHEHHALHIDLESFGEPKQELPSGTKLLV